MTKVVEVKNLSKVYQLGGTKHNSLRDALVGFLRQPSLRSEKNKLFALQDVNFAVSEGETLGIVGESGSGKSVANLSILQLIPRPPGYFPSGEIWFEGKDLLKLSEKYSKMEIISFLNPPSIQAVQKKIVCRFSKYIPA